MGTTLHHSHTWRTSVERIIASGITLGKFVDKKIAAPQQKLLGSNSSRRVHRPLMQQV
jgi:hypothetical protein